MNPDVTWDKFCLEALYFSRALKCMSFAVWLNFLLVPKSKKKKFQETNARVFFRECGEKPTMDEKLDLINQRYVLTFYVSYPVNNLLKNSSFEFCLSFSVLNVYNKAYT